MSAFWAVAAAMTLVVVAALALPLRRRGRAAFADAQRRSNVALFHDQLVELARDRDAGLVTLEQYEQARVELGKRLLADVDAEADGAGTLPASRPRAFYRYAALLLIPLLALGGYRFLGAPEAMDPQAALQARAGAQAEQIVALTRALSERVEANPADAEGWMLLGRALQIQQRPAEAAKAYARAIALVPSSAQLHADYADVLVQAANGDWPQEASASVAKALAIDAAHPKSLWLAGAEAYARADHRGALKFWEKLAPMAEPGSDVARLIAEHIAEARVLASRDGPPPAPRTQAAATAAKPAAGAVSGTVSIAPELAGEVKPEDTVFVFARAASGPKMPLAIRRVRVADLPYRFRLDDSAAMAPGMTISSFDRVVVGARVSKSGDAKPQPGDLEGYSAPMQPGTEGIAVRIDARVR